MYVVAVSIRVSPEHLDAFVQATLENARATRREPRNVRFDVLQKEEEPTRLMLYEVYAEPAAFAEHQKTAHYLAWREKVKDWMSEPRTSVKLKNLFPEDARW